MDTNPDGTSEHFLDGLSAPIEERNLAFMGFPVLHGSYETVWIKSPRSNAIPASAACC